MGFPVTPNCPWCGQEDTKFHRYFSCAAAATVRAPFQSLLDELNTLDTLWPELPVLFVSPGEDFRTVFQFALHEHEPDPHLLSEIQESKTKASRTGKWALAEIIPSCSRSGSSFLNQPINERVLSESYVIGCDDS